MRLLPKIHDVYVGKTVLGTVLLSWAVLGGLDVMLALVSEFGDIGKGKYGLMEAFAYIALSVPRRMYYLFPYAAVIGSLMALGQLAATSELTALRAVGLSRRRLGLAVAGALAILTALMVLSGESLAPWSQQRADSIKSAAKSGKAIVAQYTGLWAREGETILSAQGGQERERDGDRWLELHDVNLYQFADDGHLKSLAFVKIAEHRPGGWLLRDVTRTYFDDRSVRREQVKQERWESKLDASEFEEHYWGRWFYPINVLALCLAAVPFAFGTLRSGGMGKRLFIGIVFALGFWLLQTQFVKLATVYKFDYRVAYLLPTVIMLGVSAFLFKKRSG
jgi:lipopolysaccharide export system permease protein